MLQSKDLECDGVGRAWKGKLQWRAGERGPKLTLNVFIIEYSIFVIVAIIKNCTSMFFCASVDQNRYFNDETTKGRVTIDTLQGGLKIEAR
jgi:hypothetical protein